MEFLENKSILFIGVTGFLGKIMVEKILRTHFNVKKLYLLLRSVDGISAKKHFYDEVVEKELFRVLKEKWGDEDLYRLISKKIYLVNGDISCPKNMGIKDSNLLEEMKNQVEIIVNLAATTNFYERYDVAFNTNTLGVKHVLNFAKQCSNLEIIVHVSTAYVSNQREGLILETPCKLDESFFGTTKLDIETEQKIIEETLRESTNNTSTRETITLTMKDLGLKRAKMYGWPNTYVFTKAMGEMVINHQRDNLPLIIVRPTIVTSTYKEPFPGWIEGLRTIDCFIVGYAKQKLICCPCDVNSILDVIPADVVVNVIITTMMAHKLQRSSQTIYHVSSSMRNSMKQIDFHKYVFKYFTEKPLIDEEGNAIKIKKVTFFYSMASFRRYMTIHYLVFLKGLEFANKVFCYSFQDMYNDLHKKFHWVMRQAELYASFIFFKAKFDDSNLEQLRIATRDDDSNSNSNSLLLDPKDINWEDYFLNVHIPGLIKHVMK